MFETGRLTRRQFLALAGTALAAQFKFTRRVLAQTMANKAARIGAVLPMKTGQYQPALFDTVGEAARMGAVMAGDEIGRNAELLGMRLDVLLAGSPNSDAALRAAQRLVSVDKVHALIGGFDKDQALALSRVAEERKIPFLNIGAPSDALRGAACSRYTFHVEASAAMYLDALVDWFVRAAHRRWFFVYTNTEEGEALYRRALKAVTGRHWGAGEVGKVAVQPGQPNYTKELDAVRKARPDVVLMLLGAQDQTVFLGQYENIRLDARVTGFPDPVSQTRDFFVSLHDLAPKAGTGYRALLWETTLDAYGARELNNRFTSRWGQPMDPSAWAAYVSVKMLYEAALFTGSLEGAKLVRYMEDPQAVFDVYKGIGTSFRPWDHQLRQPLYLVKTDPEAKLPFKVDLRAKLGLAGLVGELPEIYKPGTDPIERLDQLGDLRRDSRCRF